MRLVAVVVLLVLWSWVPALWAGGPDLRPEVRLGADTLLTDPAPLAGKRVGLVTHLAGTTAAGDLTAAALARTPGVRLTALFAPEHGFDGSAGAGVPVASTHIGGAPGAILPSRTPVYSLYGGAFRPTRQMLARVDVLVVDLQDAGTRPYTYASTMALVMAAAREAGEIAVARAGRRVVGLERVERFYFYQEEKGRIGLKSPVWLTASEPMRDLYGLFVRYLPHLGFSCRAAAAAASLYRAAYPETPPGEWAILLAALRFPEEYYRLACRYFFNLEPWPLQTFLRRERRIWEAGPARRALVEELESFLS